LTTSEFTTIPCLSIKLKIYLTKGRQFVSDQQLVLLKNNDYTKNVRRFGKLITLISFFGLIFPSLVLATPVKIGFHVGPGGNRSGIGDWERSLDNAGIPFFLKSVDDAGAIWEAQQIAKASGVPHILVYRNTQLDTPDYNLDPVTAARQHWAFHKSKWPPELDKTMVWYETMNEVDKNRSEWMAEFAIETARLTAIDGFKWAAFGWSTGEPEPYHWEGPKMLEFLRLVGNNPNRLAIAVHEYSLDVNNIAWQYPWLLGRFTKLFEVTDRNGIPRPTVLITEWGWEAGRVPDPNRAISDITWANNLYAPYPSVKGAALWYLGPGFDNIAELAQLLIAPVTQWSLSTAGTNNPTITPSPTFVPAVSNGDANNDGFVNVMDLKYTLSNLLSTANLTAGSGADQWGDLKVNTMDFGNVLKKLTTNGNPYSGTAWVIPGTIEAENYNTGGEGVGYHDTTAGNTGGIYRNDGVDIEATGDTTGGAHVGWSDYREYLKYTITASTTKNYLANFRVSNVATGSNLYVEIDGIPVAGPLAIPATGAWQTFQTISASVGTINAGQHIVKIYFDTQCHDCGGNLNWFNLQ
jgi:hypothetical protein